MPPGLVTTVPTTVDELMTSGRFSAVTSASGWSALTLYKPGGSQPRRYSPRSFVITDFTSMSETRPSWYEYLSALTCTLPTPSPWRSVIRPAMVPVALIASLTSAMR